MKALRQHLHVLGRVLVEATLSHLVGELLGGHAGYLWLVVLSVGGVLMVVSQRRCR